MKISAEKAALLSVWENVTEPVPYSLDRAHGKAELHVDPIPANPASRNGYNTQISLLRLYVPPEFRREGHANRALLTLTSLADACNLGIWLQAIAPNREADPTKTMSDDNLVKLYQKHGFVRYGEGNSNTMFRASLAYR